MVYPLPTHQLEYLECGGEAVSDQCSEQKAEQGVGTDCYTQLNLS